MGQNSGSIRSWKQRCVADFVDMLWHPDVRGWSAKAGEIVTALFWRLIWAQIDFFPRIHLAWITYILRNLYSQVFKKKKKTTEIQYYNENGHKNGKQMIH